MEMKMENTTQGSGARRTVASFATYAEAQRAVDYLSDQKFPVQRVAIVAEGLRLIEQVTGRLNYGRVALEGALGGAFVGGFFGFVFGLLNWIAPLVSALEVTLYGVLYGAAVGALVSVIMYAATGGRRDFSSVGGIGADRYDVLVDVEVAAEAARLLASERPMSDRAAPTAPHAPQPI